MHVLVILGLIVLIFYIGQETGLLQFAMTVAALGVTLSGLIRIALILYTLPSFLKPRMTGTAVVLDIDSGEVDNFEKSMNIATPVIALGVALLFSVVLTYPNVARYRDPLIGQVSFIFNIGGPILAAILAGFWRFLPSVRKMAEARAASLAGEFAARTQQLNAIEHQAGSMASRISSASPPTRLPEIVSAFRDFSHRLVHGRGRAEFQTRVDGVMAAARADLLTLGSIADEIAQTELLHKDLTEAVSASNLYSLFAQVDDIWSFINSPHLSDLVRQREYDEILAQIAAVKLELKALLERARSLQPEMPPAHPAALDIWDESIQLETRDPNSLRIALARLASKEGDPPERLKRIYQNLAKAYNMDQNKDGDERRLQQIIAAYQFLRQEGRAV